MRIGFGYDIHRLVEDRKLFLGGIEISHTLGLLGHSDADVLIHAICDALLGAAALGDIGKHFPDNDEKYKDISSLILLKDVNEKISNTGYSINNIDCTIVAEKPKLNPYISQMVECLSKALSMPPGDINIKATTNEGLGPVGQEQGISAHAVVTIFSK